MLTEEELEARRNSIGGSDMSAILGLSKYEQAVDIFYRKRPDLAAEHGYQSRDYFDGEYAPAIFGNLAEEPIAQIYARHYGVKVRRVNQMRKHPRYDFLHAHPDRLVTGIRRGLEVKTSIGHWSLARDWGPTGTDEVAEYYIAQPMTYMLVLDYPEWDVAALVGGTTDLRYYRLQRDPEWDELILDAASEFWGYVQRGEPPPVDIEHRAADSVLKRVYTQIEGEAVTLPETALHWHQVAREAAEQRKRYAEVEAGARAHLKALVGNAGRAYIPGLKGAYLRKQVHRAAYEVPESTYVDFAYRANAK